MTETYKFKVLSVLVSTWSFGRIATEFAPDNRLRGYCIECRRKRRCPSNADIDYRGVEALHTVIAKSFCLFCTSKNHNMSTVTTADSDIESYVRLCYVMGCSRRRK